MDIVTLALAKKYIKTSLAGAGALKGEDGKSAYQIAKEEGFVGTKTEWLESLKGKTPYIGENGHWFIDGIDTNISASGTDDYKKLKNKPSLNGITIEDDIEITSIPLEEIQQMLERG